VADAARAACDDRHAISGLGGAGCLTT
jgi:hypothetical protein